MLKKIVNSALIELDIIPIDPLLIKSSQATVGGVDMSFVRTYHADGKAEPFIPGSSLKGMIRSYAEKICRSLRDDPVPVCLPYVEPGKENQGEKRQASCGLSFDKFKKKNNMETIPSAEIYSLSCPACRLFGSHEFIGRFSTSDAYLKEKYRQTGSLHLFETRDGVAIDRLTGGTAGGAKYDLEVLTRGEFETSLEIRNFELWQLGLIGLVLRDMEQGLIRLGFGKSRGLGRFRAEITKFQVAYYNKGVSHLSGMARLCSRDECKRYGFFPETESKGSPLPAANDNGFGLRHEYLITDAWKELRTPAVGYLTEFIKTVDWPQGLEKFMERKQ